MMKSPDADERSDRGFWPTKGFFLDGLGAVSAFFLAAPTVLLAGLSAAGFFFPADPAFFAVGLAAGGAFFLGAGAFGAVFAAAPLGAFVAAVDFLARDLAEAAFFAAGFEAAGFCAAGFAAVFFGLADAFGLAAGAVAFRAGLARRAGADFASFDFALPWVFSAVLVAISISLRGAPQTDARAPCATAAILAKLYEPMPAPNQSQAPRVPSGRLGQAINGLRIISLLQRPSQNP